MKISLGTPLAEKFDAMQTWWGRTDRVVRFAEWMIVVGALHAAYLKTNNVVFLCAEIMLGLFIGRFIAAAVFHRMKIEITGERFPGVARVLSLALTFLLTAAVYYGMIVLLTYCARSFVNIASPPS